MAKGNKLVSAALSKVQGYVNQANADATKAGAVCGRWCSILGAQNGRVNSVARERILREIKRTDAANGGMQLGQRSFALETGIT